MSRKRLDPQREKSPIINVCDTTTSIALTSDNFGQIEASTTYQAPPTLVNSVDFHAHDAKSHSPSLTSLSIPTKSFHEPPYQDTTNTNNNHNNNDHSNHNNNDHSNHKLPERCVDRRLVKHKLVDPTIHPRKSQRERIREHRQLNHKKHNHHYGRTTFAEDKLKTATIDNIDDNAGYPVGHDQNRWGFPFLATSAIDLQVQDDSSSDDDERRGRRRRRRPTDHDVQLGSETGGESADGNGETSSTPGGHQEMTSSRSKVPEDIRLRINSRERQRMHDLNSALDSLRQVMPYSSGPAVKKLSKMSTLLLARNYIVMLTKSMEEMKRLVQELTANQRLPRRLPLPSALLHEKPISASLLSASSTSGLPIPPQFLQSAASMHCVTSSSSCGTCACLQCLVKRQGLTPTPSVATAWLGWKPG